MKTIVCESVCYWKLGGRLQYWEPGMRVHINDNEEIPCAVKCGKRIPLFRIISETPKEKAPEFEDQCEVLRKKIKASGYIPAVDKRWGLPRILGLWQSIDSGLLKQTNPKLFLDYHRKPELVEEEPPPDPDDIDDSPPEV